MSQLTDEQRINIKKRIKYLVDNKPINVQIAYTGPDGALQVRIEGVPDRMLAGRLWLRGDPQGIPIPAIQRVDVCGTAAPMYSRGIEGSNHRRQNNTRDLTDLVRYLEYRLTSGYSAARETPEQEELWAKQLAELLEVMGY